MIEGPEMRRWKKRWIVLRREKEGSFLYFYKVDDFINKSSHLGSLNVNTCSIFQYFAKPFSFELVFPPSESQTGFIQPAEHFRFQASNNEERDSWMVALTPFTRPVEEMHQNLIVQRHSLQYDMIQSQPISSYTPPSSDPPRYSLDSKSKNLEKLAPPKKLRDWGDEEAVLLEMFPDVAVDVVLDALDFCNGNRNDTILLLSKQNRFKVSNDNDGSNESETLDYTETTETNFEDDEDIEDEDLIDRDEESGPQFSSLSIQEDELLQKIARASSPSNMTLNDETTEPDLSPRNGSHCESPVVPEPPPQDTLPVHKAVIWQRVTPSHAKNTPASLPNPISNQNPTSTPTPSTAEAHNPLPLINFTTSNVSGDAKLEVHVVGAVRNGSYMEYIVEVATPEEQFMVYRRYSHFHSFNNRLRKQGVANSKNVIPPKSIKGVKSDGLVSKRISGLNRYVESLVGQNPDTFLQNPIGKSFIDRNIPSALYNKHV